MENLIPFFSVIIPCFNSAPYITHLLQTIVEQQMEYGEIQVILSDDHSTEPYDKEVEPFLDKLKIVRTQTEYNCCPGNTRQAGVNVATGKWMIFCDHDDEFVPGSFKQVKQIIEKNGYSHYVKSTFKELIRNTGEVVQEVTPDKGLSWNHGKFYNRQFWNKYNIHFVKDLLSHEDVAITAQLNCIMQLQHIPEEQAWVETAHWLKNPESLSNRPYFYKDEKFPRVFLEMFYIDYLNSTGTIYLQNFIDAIQHPMDWQEQHKDYIFYTRDMILTSVLYGYYYFEHFVHLNPVVWLRKNAAAAGKLLHLVHTIIGMSNDMIVEYYKFNWQLHKNVRESAYIATGEIVQTHGFKEWMQFCESHYYATEDPWKDRIELYCENTSIKQIDQNYEENLKAWQEQQEQRQIAQMQQQAPPPQTDTNENKGEVE